MVDKNYQEFFNELLEETDITINLHKPSIFSARSHKNGTIDDIDLFISNNAQLTRQQTDPIRKNLIKKLKTGKYDHRQAVKVWLNLIDNATKLFMKENNIKQNIKDFFPKQDRTLFAKQMGDEFILEVAVGQWDSLGKLQPGDININAK